jgi:hypothetical protein
MPWSVLRKAVDGGVGWFWRKAALEKGLVKNKVKE